MNSDIKISGEKFKFKYRVSGILIVNNKLLVVRMNDNNFFCLPGGHVEIMESTRHAIMREFKEETKIETKVDRLLYVTENFFNGKLGEFHEIGFYYLLKPIKNLKLEDYTLIENDKDSDIKLEFKWADISNLDSFKPEFIKEEIKNLSDKIKHFVIIDDKII